MEQVGKHVVMPGTELTNDSKPYARELEARERGGEAGGYHIVSWGGAPGAWRGGAPGRGGCAMAEHPFWPVRVASILADTTWMSAEQSGFPLAASPSLQRGALRA